MPVRYSSFLRIVHAGSLATSQSIIIIIAEQIRVAVSHVSTGHPAVMLYPSRWATLLSLLTIFSADASIAAGAKAPEAGVEISYGDACDARNWRLYIQNNHGHRAYVVTLRWRAAGGKAITREIYIEPKVIQEVGCAEQTAEIVKAVLAEF